MKRGSQLTIGLMLLAIGAYIIARLTSPISEIERDIITILEHAEEKKAIQLNGTDEAAITTQGRDALFFNMYSEGYMYEGEYATHSGIRQLELNEGITAKGRVFLSELKAKHPIRIFLKWIGEIVRWAAAVAIGAVIASWATREKLRQAEQAPAGDRLKAPPEE